MKKKDLNKEKTFHKKLKKNNVEQNDIMTNKKDEDECEQKQNLSDCDMDSDKIKQDRKILREEKKYSEDNVTMLSPEQKNNVFVVIMAGGAGTRFWPLSRAAVPKQFLDLPECDFGGNNSMLNKTSERMSGFVDKENIFIATGRKYETLTLDCLPWLKTENLIIEEKNLDTSFGIAESLYSIFSIVEAKGNSCKEHNSNVNLDEMVVVFIPCDHYISDNEKFYKNLSVAVNAAQKDKLVTMGIKPQEPLSEYGYIEVGKSIEYDTLGKATCYKGNRFIEKPCKKRAKKLIKHENVFWNSGIFVGKAKVFVALLTESTLKCGAKKDLSDEVSIFEKISLVKEYMLQNNQKQSFDKMVMENLSKGQFLVVPVDFLWDDLGTYISLAKYWKKEKGNSMNGFITAAYNSKGNIIYREGGLVALMDVDNLLIAESDGVLLIMPKNKSHHLKKLVRTLKKQGLQEYL